MRKLHILVYAAPNRKAVNFQNGDLCTDDGDHVVIGHKYEKISGWMFGRNWKDNTNFCYKETADHKFSHIQISVFALFSAAVVKSPSSGTFSCLCCQWAQQGPLTAMTSGYDIG